MRFYSLQLSLCVVLSALSGAFFMCAPAYAETSYEELRQNSEVLTLSSIAQIRTNPRAMTGKVLELQGEIMGTLTRDGQKSILLKVKNESMLFAVPAHLSTSPLLRTGALARVLVQLSDGERSEAPRILATTAGIAATPLPSPEPAESESTFATPLEALPQAPGTLEADIRTQSQASIQPNAQPATLPGLGSGSNEEIIRAQVPAYAEVVRRHNKKLKPEVVEEIATAILRAGFRYNMDPRFLAAIIAVESDFDVYCLSKSGAMGLGQLMPFNLKAAGVKNAWNPTENIMGTAKLLRGHLNEYKDHPNSTLLAVAAYNAGPGAVRRAGYKVPNGAQVQRHVWKVYYRYKAFAPDLF